MAAPSPSQSSSLTETKKEEKDESKKRVETSEERYGELILTLPKDKGWTTKDLYQYEGFWYRSNPMLGLEGVLFAKEHFEACSTDVFLMSPPKCGTTWLKALLFAIVNRTRYTNISTDHPLLTTSPHSCVPFLEMDLFEASDAKKKSPSPRLLATHIPYTSLPKSILSTECKIVYTCRNPKDVFVSMWHFAAKLRDKDLPPLSLEEAFELFSKGISPLGPYWDHVLGYRKASLEFPRKVFFVTYEEMMRDTLARVKSLAEFLGQPFSLEEEGNEVAEEIVDICSFDALKNLEVNKSGYWLNGVKNDSYFREGKVGGAKNHLTTQMIESLDKITNEKLPGIF